MQTQSIVHRHGHPLQLNRKTKLILELPLTAVIKAEYALPLQQVLKLYTVGNLLGAWRSLEFQRSIEDVFDTPEQAHHAIATCAAWLGFHTVAAPGPVPAWWRNEELLPPCIDMEMLADEPACQPKA